MVLARQLLFSFEEWIWKEQRIRQSVLYRKLIKVCFFFIFFYRLGYKKFFWNQYIPLNCQKKLIKVFDDENIFKKRNKTK